MEFAACYVSKCLDNEEVNASLTLIQSRDKISNQYFVALSELVSVLSIS